MAGRKKLQNFLSQNYVHLRWFHEIYDQQTGPYIYNPTPWATKILCRAAWGPQITVWPFMFPYDQTFKQAIPMWRHLRLRPFRVIEIAVRNFPGLITQWNESCKTRKKGFPNNNNTWRTKSRLFLSLFDLYLDQNHFPGTTLVAFINDATDWEKLCYVTLWLNQNES